MLHGSTCHPTGLFAWGAFNFLFIEEHTEQFCAEQLRYFRTYLLQGLNARNKFKLLLSLFALPPGLVHSAGEL